MVSLCLCVTAVAAERDAVAVASRAVVDAPKASVTALCRSKAVTIQEQKVLAAVSVLGLLDVL